jgi:hypothetical protein
MTLCIYLTTECLNAPANLFAFLGPSTWDGASISRLSAPRNAKNSSLLRKSLTRLLRSCRNFADNITSIYMLFASCQIIVISFCSGIIPAQNSPHCCVTLRAVHLHCFEIPAIKTSGKKASTITSCAQATPNRPPPLTFSRIPSGPASQKTSTLIHSRAPWSSTGANSKFPHPDSAHPGNPHQNNSIPIPSVRAALSRGLLLPAPLLLYTPNNPMLLFHANISQRTLPQ